MPGVEHCRYKCYSDLALPLRSFWSSDWEIKMVGALTLRAAGIALGRHVESKGRLRLTHPVNVTSLPSWGKGKWWGRQDLYGTCYVPGRYWASHVGKRTLFFFFF